MSSEGTARSDVWPGKPSDAPSAPDGPTYYERPVLKDPVWIWAVPAYFFTGGAAGAAAVLGAAAQAADRRGLHGLVKRCRSLAAVGSAVGAVLLVHDLGRPERFLNMLRVFRPTSPLSVGSWVLAAAVPLMAGAALASDADGPLDGVGNAAGYGAGALGLPLAGYPAVLLSNTAVPVWNESRRSLPTLFVASAIASAASLLELTRLNTREQRIVRRFGLAGKVAELAATLAVEREASRIETVGRPLKEGQSGSLLRTGKVLTGVSLGLSILPGKGALKRTASALLGVAGALALKFGIFHAGQASTRDPRATFRQQRAGHGAVEVTGVPAITGPGGERPEGVPPDLED